MVRNYDHPGDRSGLDKAEWPIGLHPRSSNSGGLLRDPGMATCPDRVGHDRESMSQVPGGARQSRVTEPSPLALNAHVSRNSHVCANGLGEKDPWP